MELKKKKKISDEYMFHQTQQKLNPPSLSVRDRSWEKQNISEGKEKVQCPFMVLLYKVNCKIFSY